MRSWLLFRSLLKCHLPSPSPLSPSLATRELVELASLLQDLKEGHGRKVGDPKVNLTRAWSYSSGRDQDAATREQQHSRREQGTNARTFPSHPLASAMASHWPHPAQGSVSMQSKQGPEVRGVGSGPRKAVPLSPHPGCTTHQLDIWASL